MSEAIKHMARRMLDRIRRETTRRDSCDCDCEVTKHETFVCSGCEAERDAEEAMDREVLDEQ